MIKGVKIICKCIILIPFTHINVGILIQNNLNVLIFNIIISLLCPPLESFFAHPIGIAKFYNLY